MVHFPSSAFTFLQLVLCEVFCVEVHSFVTLKMYEWGVNPHIYHFLDSNKITHCQVTKNYMYTIVGI